LFHPYKEKIIQTFAQGTHISKGGIRMRIQRIKSIIINNNNAQCNINGKSNEKY